MWFRLRTTGGAVLVPCGASKKRDTEYVLHGGAAKMAR